MITGKKNIIKDAKTELSVGLELIKSKDDTENEVYNLKILCGPSDAINSKLDYFLTIKPSKSGSSKGTLANGVEIKEGDVLIMDVKSGSTSSTVYKPVRLSPIKL